MLIKMNLKKSVLNFGMFVSCIISCAILFRAYIMNHIWGNTGMDILSLTFFPLAMSGYVPFACVFPILPYGFSFLEEHNSGYVKSILLRMSIKKYAVQKIIFTALAGGISLLIPFILLFTYTGWVGEPVTQEMFPQVYLDHIWGKYMFIWGGWFVLVCRLVLVFLFGCVWAIIALLISVVCPNRYVTFLAPFILYQLAWIVMQGPITSLFNPVILLRSDFSVGLPLFLPFLIQMAVLLSVTIATYCLIRIRYKKENI